jgi:hypothetical protein
MEQLKNERAVKAGKSSPDRPVLGVMRSSRMISNGMGTMTPDTRLTPRPPRVHELRGELVMLASDVAKAFDVETRQIVQNIKNNSLKLPSHYAFELTEEEQEALRSLRVIPKAGRGGSRALPWALTQKGVVRLATIMESPRALEATDLVIDVFTEVMTQIAQGKHEITIPNPSRLVPPGDPGALDRLRKQIARAIDNLLETTIDSKTGTTVRDELADLGSTAVNHFKEMMRAKKISNEKIEAEALLIVEQTRDIYERRQADLAGAALDRERKALENFEKKIGIVERLLKMMDRLEPNAVVRLLPSFSEPHRLPAPGKK